ncbi:MAG TPA: hypothetical protein VEQ18_03475, partial [Candidatus Nitrosocosmicus sp.]|nr:hypothetical protein [Candidatus Nitrosocosmicus sp.]
YSPIIPKQSHANRILQSRQTKLFQNTKFNKLGVVRLTHMMMTMMMRGSYDDREKSTDICINKVLYIFDELLLLCVNVFG